MPWVVFVTRFQEAFACDAANHMALSIGHIKPAWTQSKPEGILRARVGMQGGMYPSGRKGMGQLIGLLGRLAIGQAVACKLRDGMGVRTRGLDIKAGAAKLKADRAARLEAELVVDRWNRRLGHRPRRWAWRADL